MEKESFGDIDFSILTPKIGNCSLQIVQKETEEGYHFFSYTDGNHLGWHVVYDKEVGDFTVKIRHPLFTINDIRFIKEEFTSFWTQLLQHYETAVEETLVNPSKRFTTEYKKKGLPHWDYQSCLPEKIGLLERDITPDKAILGINGSYIVGTYVLPGERTGIILYFNRYRNEFFAELLVKGVPQVTHELDAKEISAWEVLLQEKLAPLCEKLMREY